MTLAAYMTEKLLGVESINHAGRCPKVRQCDTSQLLAEISQWFVTCDPMAIKDTSSTRPLTACLSL